MLDLNYYSTPDCFARSTFVREMFCVVVPIALYFFLGDVVYKLLRESFLPFRRTMGFPLRLPLGLGDLR